MTAELFVEPVWITTFAHIEEVQMLLAQPTLWAQIFRRYPVPRGKPYLQYDWQPLSRLPVVPLVSGCLTIAATHLDFQATPYLLPGCAIYNLDTRFHFTLSIESVRSVMPQRMRSPISNQFDLPFTRVHTQEPGLLGDFLVCVGSTTGDMAAIRQQSVQLHLALEALVPGRPAEP